MDNLTSKHNDETQLLEMALPVRYEFIPRQSTEFDSHLDFISCYEGRHAHNYDLATMKRRMERENRFNIGAVKIIINEELSRSLMLEDYKGWVLISRLISHNNPKLPLLTAHGNDFILDIAKDYKGVFASVNERNKFYISCIDTDKVTMFNDSSKPLYHRHLEVISKIKKLDEPKYFQKQNQYILYRELNGSITELFGD